jgi:2-methylaconitate isomerase
MLRLLRRVLHCEDLTNPPRLSYRSLPMPQSWIKATFYRGGTSKGVFFHAADLPADRDACSRIFLDVIGSPDANGRQLDGLGGGISSLSKAVIIGPPTHADADVDYTFIQLAVDKPIADWKGNCGNLSSAVGPFAIDEGLVAARPDPKTGDTLVRIHQTNTRKIIHARFPTEDGRAAIAGDYAIAGVSGTGARIRLDFLSPGGAVTGKLLPTGKPSEQVTIAGHGNPFDISIVDASVPIAYVAASQLGLTGAETPDAIEAMPAVMTLLDQIRRAAGVRIGQGATPDAVGLQIPRVAVVAAPAAFKSLDGQVWGAETIDIATRVISMERAHRAIPGTAGLCLGVAARIEGTIPHRLARAPGPSGELRVGNPSGVIAVGAEVRRVGGQWQADSAVLFRTARRLMRGEVAVRPGLAVA